MDSMNEDFQMKLVERQAHVYEERYGAQFRLLEKTPLAKVRSLNSYDYFVLGKQLERFEDCRRIAEEQGNVNQLGVIPNIAFDVITAVQGASVLSVVASIQPIDEERGTVYFKQIRSATTRGSQTAGQVVVDPRTNIATPTGYSNNAFEAIPVQATAAGTTHYVITLPAVPLKSESLTLFLSSNTAIQAKDVGVLPGGTPGVGMIFGAGVSGTVNYASGVVTIDFAADPGAGNNVVATWQQNFELATDIPQIDQYYDSKGILARVYALKITIGALQSFGLSKRFGITADDQAAVDLVQEINREVGGDGIRKLRVAANGFASTTWSKTPPAGVSYFEHKQTYIDAYAQAEAQLITQAGRGRISCLIVGTQHAAVLQTMPGFQLVSDGTTLGSHIFGTFHGVTVVRVVEANILGANQGIGIWKGQSPFEAPLCYTPYMPLTVTPLLPQAPNPLQSMRAAAVWAGVDVLVNQYAVNFDVVP